MHDVDLIERNPMLLMNDFAGVIADGNYRTSGMNAHALNVVDLLINVGATSIVFKTVHMHD